MILWSILLPIISAIISIPLKERGKGVVVTLGSLLSALLITYSWLYGVVETTTYEWIPELGLVVKLRADPTAMVMGMTVSWVIFLIFLYSIKYMEGDYRPGWYWFFMGTFATSMLIIVFAENLAFLLFGWEGVGLCSWALIGHWYRDEEDKWVGEREYVVRTPYWWPPSKAGLRAILTVRFGDAFFLLSLGVMFAAVRTLDLSGLAEAVWSPLAGYLPLVLLFFALGPLTKSAQFPFHEWLLTAMTGPTSVSALIHAATMVKAGVYLVLSFAPAILAMLAYQQSVLWTVALLAVLGLATTLVTTLIALSSTEFKLVLAGSTAANLGIIMTSVSSGIFLATVTGVEGFAFLGLVGGLAHIVGHAVSKASLFMGFGAVIHEIHSRFIKDAGGLWKGMKLTFIAMLLAMLSLIGLPPFIGYWSKELALASSYSLGVSYMGVLYTIALLSIVFMTSLYGMRLIGLTFLGKPKEEHEVEEAHPIMLIPYAALAFVALALGLCWNLIESSFTSAIAELTGLHLELPHVENPAAIACLLVGLGASLPLYIVARRAVNLGALYKLAYYRLLMPVLYDTIAAGLWKWTSRIVYWLVDRTLFDGLYHGAFPWTFSKLASGVRRLQTGNLNVYMFYAMIGLALLLLLSLLAIA